MLVGSDEKYVDFVNAFANGKHRAGLRIIRC